MIKLTVIEIQNRLLIECENLHSSKSLYETEIFLLLKQQRELDIRGLVLTLAKWKLSTLLLSLEKGQLYRNGNFTAAVMLRDVQLSQRDLTTGCSSFAKKC